MFSKVIFPKVAACSLPLNLKGPAVGKRGVKCYISYKIIKNNSLQRNISFTGTAFPFTNYHFTFEEIFSDLYFTICLITILNIKGTQI